MKNRQFLLLSFILFLGASLDARTPTTLRIDYDSGPPDVFPLAPATQTPPAPAPAPDPRPVFHVKPGDPIQLGPDRRIIFLAAQTYPINTNLYAGFANLSLEGPPDCPRDQRPVIKWAKVPAPPVWDAIIQCSQSTLNLNVSDLVLDSDSPDAQGAKPRGIRPQGKNITIKNVTGLGVGDFINCELNPDTLTITNCDVGTVWGYGVWIQGRGVTIDGFKMRNSRREHCIRGYGSNIVIQNCDLANTADPLDPADFSKATIRLMGPTDGAALENNDCGPGDVQIGADTNEDGIAQNITIKSLRLRGGALLRYGGKPAGGAANVTLDAQPLTPVQWK